jgi:hypothetical protein
MCIIVISTTTYWVEVERKKYQLLEMFTTRICHRTCQVCRNENWPASIKDVIWS